MLVDSHCHLQLTDYVALGSTQEEVIANATADGIIELLCVATKFSQSAELKEIADKFEKVKVSIGVHPNECSSELIALDELVEMLNSNPKIIAVGETGLDYFRNKDCKKTQQQSFATHIQAGIITNKPVIVHTRDARFDTIDVLAAENVDKCGGVIHCFTEDLETAYKALDLGMYISFSGIVTFKNAVELQEVAKKVPLNRILIETDSPYLAPTPLRGRMNQPRNVKLVAEFLASLLNTPFDEIASMTTQNYKNLFLDR